MNLYTIGFTQKTAKQFFDLIKSHHIDIVVDIRLNNKSQLAGFSKGDDLEYFLAEICKCKYEHREELAPTKALLDDYKKKVITWDEYVSVYVPLINKRNGVTRFIEHFGGFTNVCLLCSEPTAKQCHRRLLAEMIQSQCNCTIRHI